MISFGDFFNYAPFRRRGLFRILSNMHLSIILPWVVAQAVRLPRVLKVLRSTLDQNTEFCGKHLNSKNRARRELHCKG